MAIQRNIDILNSRFTAQEIVDKYVFDTIAVPNGTTSQKFFESLQGKQDHQAQFEGDKALVKEGRVFEVRFLLCQVLQQTVRPLADLLKLELQAYFDVGSYEWTTANVLFDQDVLRRISGGIQLRPVAQDTSAGANAVSAVGYWGDGRQDNVRVYSIAKVVPGGREVKFELQWERAGGSENTPNFDTQISFFGIEMVPLAEVAVA